MLQIKLTEKESNVCSITVGCNRIEPRKALNDFFYVPISVLEIPDLPLEVETILREAPQEDVDYESFPEPTMEG